MSAWAKLKGLPATVWTLGFVSLLMDVSSELIHSLLPIFLVTTLGASAATYGVLEGIAEATSSLLRVFSGAMSDWLGKRKRLALIGYGLSTATKPLFALAASATDVFVARFLDRVGKGIRGTPRDALIADVTPSEARGAAYGLRQSLDTAGAFIGPLAAIVLMSLTHGDMRAVFWWSLIPAVLAVVLLARNVEEPETTSGRTSNGVAFPLHWTHLKAFGQGYWHAIAIVVAFSLARYSEGFLILRAADAGLPANLAPLVLLAMNLVYALVAAPAGVRSDSVGRPALLIAGMCALLFVDLWLGYMSSLTGVFVGIAGYGVHLGLTQGLFSALVADSAQKEWRATAFGMMNLAMAMALLIANTLAGVLWQALGAKAMFLVSAGFAATAILGYVAILVRDRQRRET